MCKRIKRYLAVFMAVSILFSGISLQITTAYADAVSDSGVDADFEAVVDITSEVLDYTQYMAANAEINKATTSLKLPLNAYVADGAEISADDDSLIWKDGNGKVTWEFEVPATALYNLSVTWKPQASGVDVVMGILIDGKEPFIGCDEIVLSREWKNADGGPRKDVHDNEYAPEQVETGNDIVTVLRDYEGAIVNPFEFALEAGTHTITIIEPEQSIAIKDLSFTAPEKEISYDEYLDGKPSLSGVDASVITIEGENADIKSSNSIIPKSNNSDAGMTSWDGKGSDPYHTKINYIGGTSWQTTGSKLEWKFNVKESGYYHINMRYKQSELVNGVSYRWLKVDGETPFKEAKTLAFEYGTNWEYYSFADGDNDPYYIYLEEGDHTISLEVTVATMTEYFYELSQLVDILGDEYIKIVMITSESPDVNRDYELDQKIPGFLDTLKNVSGRLDKLSNAMTNGTGQASQAVASIDNMKRVVDNMIKSPYIAQQYVSEYYSNYTSISSWLYDMIEMPLAIDQIQVVPHGKEYQDNSANFFESLAFGVMRLISSFTSDYSLTGADESDENTIRLWVNWGQDQAAALNALIQESFTGNEKYYYKGKPINVQVEIVNASLINGILAGNFPDVSLQMARTEPVNLGIRGALADLSQFDNFEEVITSRFQGCDTVEQALTTGAVAPYTYDGATYALPDTQNFMLMFYRKDVLEELGLIEELGNPNPDINDPTHTGWTWDDFLYAATIIQRNNMNVYVPFTQITTSTTVNAGIGNLHLFPTLMWQHDLKIYNDDGTATDLLKKEALDVFEQWTDFYLEYDFLKEADFYNRLRVGVMPLGIAPYTTYMTLYSTAPEIRGRWGIAMVPGTMNEETGEINRKVAGSGTGCAIIEKSSKKEQAWLFLQWWTDAKTQEKYNNNLQSLLGMIGRNAVSNTEAFEKLAWDKQDLEVLVDQWAQVNEVQEVPGSYDVTRSIDQAFWAVLEDDAKVKDAVTKWSKSADKEIARKIKEYS